MRLLYFAWLRERIGVSAEDVTLPPEVQTVATLMAWQRGRGGGYGDAFAETNVVRCAVDQEFAGPAALVAHAAEIGFFPPVTGG